MISTYSKFYYGVTIDRENRYLDFNEGASDLVATCDVGTYSITDLATELQTQINASSATGDYTVSLDRSSRKITISKASGTFDILGATGDNVGNDILPTIGFTEQDYSAISSQEGQSAAVSAYEPQFKLQSYISTDNWQESISATVNEATDGRVQVQKFGTKKFMQCNIRFCTDIAQPSNGPIISDTNGVANVRAFLQHLVEKNHIEFMPDKATEGTFETFILESSEAAKDGTGYRLRERWDTAMPGYYDTGVLIFRLLE